MAGGWAAHGNVRRGDAWLGVAQQGKARFHSMGLALTKTVHGWARFGGALQGKDSKHELFVSGRC